MTALNWRNPPPRFLETLKIPLLALGCVPLGLLVARGLAGALGANPIEAVIHRTGWWTLALLLGTLAVTPLRRLTGLPWIGRFRRMLGLFAFFYAALHCLAYAGLDQYFSWPDILADIAKRPYITLGFTAFLMLVPLAATSTDGMVRRLGGRAWRRLHKLIYPVAIAGVIHFWWLVKKDIREPAAFAAVLAVLLGVRLVYALRQRRARRIPAGLPGKAVA